MRLANSVWVSVAMLAGACGSDDRSQPSEAAFTPATTPDDVCALLTSEEVASVLPSADAGESSEQDFEDAWIRECFWHAPENATLELQIIGAVTPVGQSAIIDRPLLTNQGGLREEVSGLGDQAVYIENSFGEVAVAASSGGYLVEVLADWDVKPSPEREKLVTLVRQILRRIGK